MIDERICKLGPATCKVKLGTCTEIDHCPQTLHMIVGLVLLVLGPPVFFGIVGFISSSKMRPAKQWALFLLACVVTHWSLTFSFTRLGAI